MYKLCPSQNMDVVLYSRWQQGVWLGRTWGTISHRIVVDERHVIEARAIPRVPLCESWDLDSIAHQLAVPWLWRALEEPTPEAIMAPRPDGHPVAAVPLEKDYVPRRVYITQADLEQWGYTATCRRCKFILENRPCQGVAHSAPRRNRMDNCLK